jgi:putative ABC transport system substrate-binding protein
MRRREFIAGLGGAVAWPPAARAQRGPLPVIGLLSPYRREATTTASIIAAYLDGLKEGGYVEGRNIAIEYRWGEEDDNRLPALAADLVRRQVKVIVAVGLPAALAAKEATTTIPIVFQLGIDPVRAGLVASLNRPGGNITGITNVTATLAAKRLELLHRLTPKVATIGVLIDPANPSSDGERTDVRDAAGALGLRPIFLNATDEHEIDAAFATLVQRRIEALLLTDSGFFNGRREQLVTLARFNAIPTMYTFREFAVAGGLISYASTVTDTRRQAGIYVARVLNGEKPGDLPVQLPNKFELVINLKTAKALGLTVPPTLLAIADEVIE